MKRDFVHWKLKGWLWFATTVSVMSCECCSALMPSLQEGLLFLFL